MKTRTFSAQPESVAAARRFTTSALSGTAHDTVEAIELMVSELATNCIRHTKTGFELRIGRTADQIRVEVTDHAGGTPRMRRPEATEPTGRGLQIVDLLSEEWGVDQEAGPGKTVWFVVAAPAASEPRGQEQSERGRGRNDPDAMSTVRSCARVLRRRSRLAPAYAL